jgi:6-pyruvoyltetrahydropterin/6-carboxytetrahydropterin synthase
MIEKFELRVKSHFDAAHCIRDYVGKCSRKHGHRWVVEAVLEGTKLDGRNMLVDFGDVKLALATVIDERLDHYDLNETLMEPNVTAEYLAGYVFRKLQLELLRYVTVLPPRSDIKLVSVAVWESPECCVKYYGS